MRVFELKFATNPENRHIPRRMIKVEIAACEPFTREIAFMGSSYDFLPANMTDLLVKTQSLDEILADKLLALPAAFHGSTAAYLNIRYRDFFDIWFLQQQLGAKFDPDLLQRKIDDYAVANFEEALEDALLNIKDKMKTEDAYLQHISRYFPQALFQDIVRSCQLETHVDLALSQLQKAREQMPTAPTLAR